MSETATAIGVQCARCGEAREKARLPRGWKRHCAEVWCATCWRAAYMLRAITLPVAGPVGDETWADLRPDLHQCWSDATACANWAVHELARSDVTRTPDMDKLPAMERVYLYPGARAAVPNLPSGTVVSLLQAVERRYRAARWDVTWRRAKALPTYRYPTPYPVHNQRWSVRLDDQGVPVVTVPLASRKWDIALRRKNRGRQLAAIRKLVDGEAARGELAIYERRGVVMAKLVVWLPRPTTHRQKSGMLHVRTSADSFLVYHVDDGEPRYLHADDIRRVCVTHRRRLDRISDDTKAEKRKPRARRRGIDKRRREWAGKYNRRMDAWTHDVTAMLANYAARQKVERVVYDDTGRSYLPDAPYHAIRERLGWKLDERGIALEIASGEVVNKSAEALDGED